MRRRRAGTGGRKVRLEVKVKQVERIAYVTARLAKKKVKDGINMDISGIKGKG